MPWRKTFTASPSGASQLAGTINSTSNSSRVGAAWRVTRVSAKAMDANEPVPRLPYLQAGGEEGCHLG